jgi:short-subunit dehydrogenase
MELTPSSTVLVTGANGGLGQAIARAVRAAGAQVILSGRRADALAGIAADTGARVIVADLARREDVARLAAEAGEVDVLVANAALPATGPIEEFTEAELDRALDVNLRAPIVLTWALAKGMMARGRGHVVVIGSIASKVASPGSAMYSATKFGLRGFALGLRQDLAASGVGVTGVYPGFIRDAGMFASTGVALPPGVGTRSPEDVAEAVLRAVRENPAEIDVAAIEQRLGAKLAGLSAALSEHVQAAFGAKAKAAEIGERQRAKR